MKFIRIPFSINPLEIISNTMIEEMGVGNLKESIFISPNIRTGLYLTKKLAEIIKKEFIPPIRFSMDDFIKYLAKKQGYKVGEPSILDHTFLIYEIIKKRNIKIVEYEKEKIKKEYEILKWSYEIFKSIKEMNKEGIKSNIIKAMSRSIKDYGEDMTISKKIKNIWYEMDKIREEFNNNVSELGGTGLEYMKVKDNKENIKIDRPIYLWGIYALTNTEMEIIKEITNKEEITIFVQFNEEMIKKNEKYPHIKRLIDNFGIPESITGEEKIPEIKIHKGFTIHSETKKLFEILKKKNKDENLCIVLPEESNLFPTIEMSLSPYIKDIKFNITMGFPLKRTPFYSLFKKHLALLEEFKRQEIYSTTLFSFLKHPYIKTIKLEDLNIKEIITKEDKGFLQFSPESLKIYMGKSYEKIEKEFISPFMKLKDPSEFAETMKKFLLHVVYEKTEIVKKFSLAQEFMYYIIKKVIEEMKGIKIEVNAINSYKTFIFMIERTNVPFRGEPLKGVQIMGVLETRGIKFKDVVIMDVNEGILPKIYRSDPLLPIPIRKYLGLPLPEDTESVYRYHFYRLIMGAESVDILYREGINTEDKKSISRFVEELIWRQKIENIKNIKIEFQPGIRIKRTVKKNKAIMESIKTLNTFSHAQLSTYIECPVKFYFKYILGISDKTKEEEKEVTPLKAGEILHKVLKELYQEIKSYKLLSGKFYHFLKKGYKLINKEILNNFKGVDIKKGRIGISRLLMKKNLLDFLKTDKERIFYDVEVEKRLSKKVIIDEDEYIVYGIIDRIEKNEHSNKIIIDYKTGRSKSKEDIPSIFTIEEFYKKFPYGKQAFQILLYLYIVNATEDDRGMIYYLLDNKTSKPINYKKEIEKVIKEIIKEINDPEKEFGPREKPFCEKSFLYRCPYIDICEIRKNG